MTDVAAAPKPARNMKPMPKVEPVMQPLPVSPVPPTRLREAITPRLLPRMFSETGHGRVCFEATIPADWDYDDTLDPHFWVNIAPKLMKDPYRQARDFAGSFIDLGTEDHAFYARLYVLQVQKDGLVVKCLGPSIDPATGMAYPLDLKTGGPWAGRKFAVRWNKEERGYDVIRKEDGVVIAGGDMFPTAELAVAFAVAAGKKAA